MSFLEQEGLVPGLVPDIPHPRWLRGAQEAADPAPGEAHQEAGGQRVPILLWAAAPLPGQRDAPARPGGHRWAQGHTYSGEMPSGERKQILQHDVMGMQKFPFSKGDQSLFTL